MSFFDPLVTLYPAGMVRGWDPTTKPNDLDPAQQLFATVNLSEALQEIHSTRAAFGLHHVAVEPFASGELSFRPHKRCLKDPGWSQALQFGTVAVDLDAPNHSIPDSRWYQEHIAIAKEMGALLYTTLHGARLVWTLGEYLNAIDFVELLRRVEPLIAVLCPNGYDKATGGSQATRLYFLPNVVREEGPYQATFYWPDVPGELPVLDEDRLNRLVSDRALADGFLVQDLLERGAPVPIRLRTFASEGERNDYLFKHGCSFRARGFSDERIWEELLQKNEAEVDPPVEEEELLAIHESVLNYEVAARWQVSAESPVENPLPSKVEEPVLDLHAQIAAAMGQAEAEGAIKESFDAPLPDQGGVTIANRTKARLIGRGKNKSPIAFAEGSYWKYNTQTGIWDALDEELIKARIIEWWQGHQCINNKGQLYPLSLGSGKVADVAVCLRTVVSAESGDDFFHDAPPGVVFANGFVDAQGELHQHSASHKARFRLDSEYCPETTPLPTMLIETLLGGCWADLPDKDDMVQMFREALGISLVGLAPQMQKAFLLYGPGENGKSQVLEVIAGLFPPEATTSVMPQKLSEEYHAAQLPGKRLNILPEVPNKDFTETAGFKAAVDGSPMMGRHPAGRPFSFQVQAAFWFAVNKLLQTKDHTHGFYRRWVLFPFGRKIPKSERIQNLGKIILKKEGAAIATWAIQSVKDVLERGDFKVPESAKALKQRWRGNVEPLTLFFAEEFLGKGEYMIKLPRTEVFRKYAHHTEMSADRPMKKAEFYEYVREHYAAKDVKTRGNWCLEIDLTNMVTDDVVEAAYSTYCAKILASNKDAQIPTVQEFAKQEGLDYGR